MNPGRIAGHPENAHGSGGYVNVAFELYGTQVKRGGGH